MQINEFESQFKSSIKERYQYQAIELERVLVITDESKEETPRLLDAVSRLVPAAHNGGNKAPNWEVISSRKFATVSELLSKISQLNPSLIIAERNLQSTDEDLVYGLSNSIDAITQVSPVPVILLPNGSVQTLENSLRTPDNVLVETNHITGDNNLINWGVRFSSESGVLYLTHIENDVHFKYYLDVISRIPEIDTEIAEDAIKRKLLQLPDDFIESVQIVLSDKLPHLAVEGVIRLGHTLSDYRKLLDEHQIDLLVLNTKTEGQLAMDGMAYTIAVEFKHVPLLLL